MHPRCGKTAETVMHMIQDCEEVSNFWCLLTKHVHWQQFFHIGMREWISFNLAKNMEERMTISGNYCLVSLVGLSGIIGID